MNIFLIFSFIFGIVFILNKVVYKFLGFIFLLNWKNLLYDFSDRKVVLREILEIEWFRVRV